MADALPSVTECHSLTAVRHAISVGSLSTSTSPYLQIDHYGRLARTVFFFRNLGFVEPTAARRIRFEDSLAFERLHERTYLDPGFHLVNVPAGSLTDRVALIQQIIGHQQQ